MDTNPFYTLVDSRNFAVQRLLKKAGLDPLDTMRSIVNTCKANACKGGDDAKYRLIRPIDMTLRELSFAARAVDVDVMDLIKDIAEMPTRDMLDGIKNWKSDYELERARHEQCKAERAQRFYELEACHRIIAELRRVLHKEGLQDPTLQIVRPAGDPPVGASDKEDAAASNPQASPSGGGREGAHGNGADAGHHHNGGVDSVQGQ